MAEQATMKGARGSKTVLKLGLVTCDVQLYGTVAAPSKLAQFETAGPNGGVLRREQRAVEAEAPENAGPVPIEEDPGPEEDALEHVMAEEPTPEGERAAAFRDAERIAAESSVPGEYRTVLVEEGTDIEVPPEDVRRGVRLEDGRFVDCTEELASIEQHTQLDRMEVIGTVDATRLPTIRVQGSFYLTANGGNAPKVLRALYEAMRETRRMAVVKWTQKTRQKAGVILPRASTGALVVLELAWAEDFRAPGPRQLAHQQAKVSRGMVEQTVELLREMRDSTDLMDELRDAAIELREELRQKALDGKVGDFSKPPVPQGSEEPDLEELLAASVRERSGT